MNILRMAGNRDRWRIYSMTDQGSRAQFNTSILKHNRDHAAGHAQNLQAQKARFMQARAPDKKRMSEAMHW